MTEKMQKPRSDSKMYQLPKDVLDQVNDMLLNENMKYSDIQYWLETEHNMKISLSSISNYAVKIYQAAQRISDDLERTKFFVDYIGDKSELDASKASVAESRTNFTLERRKKQPTLLLCANCGHSLLKETEHLLKCSDARTNGDPVCRSLVLQRELLEENILGLVHQYAASMLEKEKKISSKRQCEYKEINTAELQKQSRQLTSEKMKLYDDYKDGRIDRDSYKQRAGKISVQLEEIKRKMWYMEIMKKKIT